MTPLSLADRLVDAHARLAALRTDVERHAPWPPTDQFGVEPEATWNPPELLAHLAEMLPYWVGQIDRILTGYPEPVSFGRVQSDEDRIAAIGRDRMLPLGELFDRVSDRVDVVASRLRSLSEGELERLGTHPTLGEMTVGAVVERMHIRHLDDHVDQLTGILERTGRTD